MRYLLTALICATTLLSGCGPTQADKVNGFLQAEMYEEARTLLLAAILDNPDDPELHYLLGVSYLKLVDMNAAKDAFRRAISLNYEYSKSSANAFIDYAQGLVEEGNLSSAIPYFQAATKINPNSAPLIASKILDNAIPRENVIFSGATASAVREAVSFDSDTKQNAGHRCLSAAQLALDSRDLYSALGFSECAFEYGEQELEAPFRVVAAIALIAAERDEWDAFRSAYKILSSMPYKPEILEDVKQAARVKDRLDQLSPLTMLWNTPLVSHGYGLYGTFTPPSIADGLIFTANGKTIYALQSDHGQIIWQRELSWWVHQESPLDVSAGHVWVATGGDAYKLDMYTGNIVWRTRLPGNGTVTETQQVASKAVILGDGGLYVLNGSNGQMEWHNEVAAGDGFASYKSYIYVGARNKTTASEQANGHRAGNSTDPEQLKITISSLKKKQQDWMAISNEERRSGTNTAQLDHEIDVLKKRISDLEQELTGKQMNTAELDNASTKLIEFSIFDGKVEREYTVASWPRWKPTVYLGVIYFVDIGETLHALNIDDWKLKWTQKLEGRTYSPPVVFRDVLYISTDHTYAIHAESGQVKWEQDFGIGTMAPLVDIHGIYVSATEYTENPNIASTIPPFTTGKKMAKDYNAKQIEEMESRFREVGNYQGNLIEDGFGYLSFIYRLDIESGRMIWKQRVASLVDSHCTPAEEEGVLFVGFNDGTFAAYQK